MIATLEASENDVNDGLDFSDYGTMVTDPEIMDKIMARAEENATKLQTK